MIGLMSHVVPRTFPVIDISAWDAGEIEEMGARDKLWVTSDPDVGLPSHLWKAARSHGKLPDYGADSCAERMAAESLASWASWRYRRNWQSASLSEASSQNASKASCATGTNF